ncbi:MAG: hypothetical protein WC817_01375 [Patescibacteria group bacterium]
MNFKFFRQKRIRTPAEVFELLLPFVLTFPIFFAIQIYLRSSQSSKTGGRSWKTFWGRRSSSAFAYFLLGHFGLRGPNILSGLPGCDQTSLGASNISRAGRNSGSTSLLLKQCFDDLGVEPRIFYKKVSVADFKTILMVHSLTRDLFFRRNNLRGN